MRVLHVIPSVSPRRGGPSVLVASLGKALVEAGCHIDILTTDDDGQGRLKVSIAEPVTKDDLTYRHFRRNIPFYTVSLGLQAWLKKNITFYDIVHIHALFSFPSVVAARIAYRKGVPYIIRPLGTLTRYGLGVKAPLKKMSLRFIERQILERAVAVHFTSEAERDEAQDLAQIRQPVVIVNPVALRRSFTGPRVIDDPYVLFMSRLDEKKGLEMVLEAFAEISLPSLRLVVAGSGTERYERQLRALARRLGIDEIVVWCGHVEGPTKESLLSNAAVFVLPSQSENFGIAAVESMAAGTPIIISPQVGIAPTVRSRQAGIVTGRSSKELKEAITRLTTDEDLRARFGHNGRELVRDSFSPAAVGKVTFKLYRDLLQSSPT